MKHRIKFIQNLCKVIKIYVKPVFFSCMKLAFKTNLKNFDIYDSFFFNIDGLDLVSHVYISILKISYCINVRFKLCTEYRITFILTNQ